MMNFAHTMNWQPAGTAQFAPRWYQEESVQAIFDYFNSGERGNPVIALPTAAGKTIVIAELIKRILSIWPNVRFAIVTHVKELVEQNASKFAQIWPHAPYGVYSAGLNSRDFMQPIIFGSVQSMVNAIDLFGTRDIIIIDEAHLVGPGDGTRYQDLINGLKKANPFLKVVGLSATIYRMGLGYITDDHEGRVFTDIAYDLTTIDAFARLTFEGFLSPLIARPTVTELDITGVKIGNNHEYNQKQLNEAIKAKERITLQALDEAIYYGQNRRSWLAFSAGVEHAEMIAEKLRHKGISAVAVHSKLDDPNERDRRINAHKRGEVRCLVGNNIFTTGYDHPPLDMIIDLQPTNSTPKHVQKLGRAMRISPQTFKENGLVLDFARNCARLGPINDPIIPRRKGEGSGEAPVKICDGCGNYLHISCRVCPYCGHEFEFKEKITRTADTTAPMADHSPIINWHEVTVTAYFEHVNKITQNRSLQVVYFSGAKRFSEFVSVESKKAKHFYHEWWRQRHPDEPPETVADVLRMQDELRSPSRILVYENAKPYPKIERCDFDGNRYRPSAFN